MMTIALVVLAVVIHGTIFAWAACRAAKIGDEAMEIALAQERAREEAAS